MSAQSFIDGEQGNQSRLSRITSRASFAVGLLITAGCTNDTAPASPSSVRGKEAVELGTTDSSMNDAAAEASSGACNGPAPGSMNNGPIVGPTAGFVDFCAANGCNLTGVDFLDPSQAALDYGDFPFRVNGRAAGTYFYAVVAPGFESGFADGATGNLSDAVPSTVAGDRGHGDTRADRTIFISVDQVFALAPTSHGTHATSSPPSQYMAISLVPFDTTPDGHYVLAVCPANATSRCDCVFEGFVVKPAADGGTARTDAGTGAGGATGAGSASSGGVAGSDGAGGYGGALVTPGAGGAPESGGGMAGASAAPCLPDAAAAGASQDAGRAKGSGGTHTVEAGADTAPCDTTASHGGQ
jgi:hypothetical protein